MIDDYLARADALMTATHEGRAFEGAFALLRDDALVTQLREDLTDLLEHPLSDRLLSDADRAELRGTVRLVRDGLDRVLAQRSRVTATLKEYIVSHDAARDRELEQTLRQVEAELMTWMATTGPRAAHDVPLLPPRTGIDHLRERFYDPADDVLPDRISTPDPDLAPPVSLAELVAQGGPKLAALRERLDAVTTSLLPVASLGALFDGLEPSLRRPVEIFGLLHLAADRELAGRGVPGGVRGGPPRREQADLRRAPHAAARPRPARDPSRPSRRRPAHERRDAPRDRRRSSTPSSNPTSTGSSTPSRAPSCRTSTATTSSSTSTPSRSSRATRAAWSTPSAAPW